MTPNPDVIEREVEEQRHKVQETLAALQEKLSPGQLADQVSQIFTGSGGSAFAQSLGGKVKDNPIPVTLVGLGLAWLMMSDRSDQDTATPSVSSHMSHARGAGSPNGREDKGLAGKAGDAVSDLGEKATDAADRAREASSRYAARAKRGFFETLDEQPMLLGALGVAVGAALGAALPPTRTEDEWIGEASDRVKETVAEIGQEQLEKTRETVKSAAGGDERSA